MRKEQVESIINPRILTDKELADFCVRFMEEQQYMPLLFQNELAYRFSSKVK